MTPNPVSRRQALGGGLCLCCSPGLIRGAYARAPALTTTEVAPGIHIRRGAHEEGTARNENAIANIGFIIGREAVAVTESGGSLKDGQRLRARIRELTSRPIRVVVMSHVHPDHIFGAGAFLPDEPAFVGHANLSRALAERGEFYQRRLEELLGPGNAGPIVQPTMLVHDEAHIDLGGRVLQLKAHGIGHTNCDLSLLDRQTQTLFPADLLFVGRVPSLDGSVKGWLQELAGLRALGVQRAVPGHGPASVRFLSAALPLEQYLEVLLTETRQAIARGIEIDAAADTVARSQRDQWTLFDAYHGHNVIQAFKELEWE
ncbi:MAG TPA: quinoprotein relay system zinc metallohydrolase 2 [Steroidobacteraceae bacterium]|nr:quinoprotein relay system zinc metallohydrolase 2 [Steroidobacteraceae bacterium]